MINDRQKLFSIPFEFLADDDIKVYLTPAGQDPNDTADVLVLSTQYSLTGAGVTGGGNRMRIGDRELSITSAPEFQTGHSKWKPANR